MVYKRITIPYTNNKVTIFELLTHIFINLIYGFLAGSLPTVVYKTLNGGSFVWLILISYIFYLFLSIFLARDKYETWLGKYIIFPAPITIGFCLGVYLMKLI